MIPEGWQKKMLSQCAAKITSGGTPKIGRDDYYGGNIPFLKIDDITSSNSLYLDSAKTMITEKAIEETSARLYPTGTVLVTMYGTIGEVGITSKEMSANQAIAAFLDLKDTNPEFLAYLLTNEAIQLANKSGRTTQANISGTILKTHEALIPPVPEQKIIAAILSSVDDGIQATQAVIDQTRTVKQGLMQQLLTRGIGHTGFKQTEIGEIPEDWRIRRVDDIASVFSGGTPSRSNMDFYRGNIPWVKSGETNQEFITITNEFITEEAIKNSSAKWAKNGDVLIAMYGATAGKVATLCIDATINQAIACVSAQPNKALNQFLHYTFQHMTPLLLRKSQGSGQPNLSGQIIKSTEILIPPLPEQKKIASILRSVDETLKAEHEKLQQNIRIKKGLMQDLLTGRVRVKPDEVNTT